MSNVRVLVVDDEELNRLFLRTYLEAAGFLVDEAVDGAAAWRVLQARPGDFDAVLMDWRMPQMDGLEVLAKMKADPKLAPVPVIMQTAMDSEKDLIEAIDAGVYYYLTKPYDAQVLASVAERATEEYARHRRVVGELAKRTGAIRLLVEGRFRLRTPQEADSLAVLLASGLDRSPVVAMGLLELLINGIEHGNLALDYSQKSELMKKGEWDAVVAARLEDPAFKDRWVTIDVRRDNGECRFTITDEGEGFDWRDYEDIRIDRLFDSHGRGIAMARKMAFASLSYQGRGNIVEAVVRHGAAAPAKPRPLVVVDDGLDAGVRDALRKVKELDVVTDAGARRPALVIGAVPSDADVPAILIGGTPPPDAVNVMSLPADPVLAEAACRALLLPDGLGRDDAAALAAHMASLPPPPQALSGGGIAVATWSNACAGVSGDTWGGRRLADGRRAIFIADMTGHGPEAGINAVRLHHLWHLHADLQDDPAALLRRLDADLKRILPASDYAAMLAGVADPATGRFVYAAAGVPDPLVVAGREVTPGNGRGMPAGASGAFPYETRELTVPPGASLVLYSDGLDDLVAPGATLREARDRIAGVLTAGPEAAVAARLAALIEGAPRPCTDDITAVCLTRMGG